MAWVVEIGPVSYPDSLFASCGRLPYPYADRLRHVWNLSPSLTDDARVKHVCLTFTLTPASQASSLFVIAFIYLRLLIAFIGFVLFGRFDTFDRLFLDFIAYRVYACAVREDSWEIVSNLPNLPKLMETQALLRKPAAARQSRPFLVLHVFLLFHTHCKVTTKNTQMQEKAPRFSVAAQNRNLWG